jgi:MFS family permease
LYDDSTMSSTLYPTTSTRAAYGRFGLLCFGVWLHSADTLVTATIAPSIVDELGSVAYINWTITLYEVGAIIAGAAVAAVCIRFGIKRVFVGATILYALGCAMGALAPTMSVLVFGRFVQGMGGGMLLSLCYIAVEAWFTPQHWGRLFGIVALVWGVGSLIGPLIGGAFAGGHDAAASWRGAFWAFGAQAALLCVFALISFPASTPTNASQQQWPVMPLLWLSAATLIIAQAGASSSVGFAIAGCAIGGYLLYRAARLDGAAPRQDEGVVPLIDRSRTMTRLLPAQLLDPHHPIGAGLLLVFTLSAATTGFWAYGPLLLKILFGTRPIVTGYILAGEAVAWSVATLAVSKATPADDRWIIRTGTVGVALGSAGFALAVPLGTFVGMIVCGLMQGAGFGLCWRAIVQRIVRAAEPSEQSLAASPSTIQRIGYAVGIAANLSGLADGVSTHTAKTAGFWVFAAFIPVLLVGLKYAWAFTAPSRTKQ